MKNLRVMTVGLLSGWLVLQFIYIPFAKYFLNHSRLYAFSLGLETNFAVFHTLTMSILVVSVILFSISIGMLMAVLIYHPIEKFYQQKFRWNAAQNSMVDG